MARVLRLFLLLAVVLSSAEGKKKDKAPVVKSDLPYIRCQVCQELAKTLARSARAVRQEKGQKFREENVLELVEKACDPDAEAGEWLTRLDLVPRGKRLAVEAQEGPGKCGSTCRTLARACEEALGDWDTDVAEALFRNDSPSPRAWLEGLLCRELSGACAKPAPPLAAGRPPSPPFEPKSEQDLEMEKMMRGLADVPGMPGMSLYSRDDLAGMVGETGAELEEELDDEEEPPPPPKPAQPKPKPELKPKPKPKPAPKAKAAKPSGQSGGEAARAAARRAAKAAEAARERLSGAIGGALDRAGRVAQAGAARFERGVEWTAEQVSRGYSWAEERLKKKEDL